jgi:threonine dehydratase
MTFDPSFPTIRSANAGTVGLELLEDTPDAEVIVVPAGGGGLMAGVASAARQLAPKARVVAVELAAGPGFGPSLAAGRPIPTPRPKGTIADGLTPPFVGALPLAIARESVDAIVTVSEEEIRDARAGDARQLYVGAGRRPPPRC